MKKILPLFALLLLLTPMAQAATVVSEYYTTFFMSQTRDLSPATITATAENEITAENGIDIFFAPGLEVLWDATPTLTATGKAVAGNKISATLVPVYKNNYSTLHIPVLGAFSAGDDVVITGLRMRAYRRPFGQGFLQVDFNGDGVSDAQDTSRFTVQNIQGSDFTPPYPPFGFTATLGDDLKSVRLAWSPSPDFDQVGTNLDRIRIRDGVSQATALLSVTAETSYTDTDIRLGDTVTYSVTAKDRSLTSEPVTQSLKVEQVAETLPPTVKPPETSEQSEELTGLQSLFNYYKTRQAIKCREGVPLTDSACLWAKIDLVYAQDLLSRAEVDIALSARDLELIRSRIQWPENRYQTKCIEATVKDKTCPALEKSLKRAHYFID